MADLDKITASNGTTYNIKDATARDSISHWALSNATMLQLVVSSKTNAITFVVTASDGRDMRLSFEPTNQRIRYIVDNVEQLVVSADSQ